LDRRQEVELKPKQLPKVKRIKSRRNLTLDEHRRVIWLRFGSLDKYEKMHHTSKEVFEMTGVKPSTQYMIIKRWLQHGKRVISLV
jgi:transposase